MDLHRIYELRKELEQEQISWGELAEINDAFEKLVVRGVDLRDDPGNAVAGDQLEELEANASTVEIAIYQWCVENDVKPTFSTHDLAAAINQIPVIMGSKNSALGYLLGDLTEKEIK